MRKFSNPNTGSGPYVKRKPFIAHQEAKLAEHFGGDDVHDGNVGLEHDACHQGTTHISNLLDQSSGSSSTKQQFYLKPYQEGYFAKNIFSESL